MLKSMSIAPQPCLAFSGLFRDPRVPTPPPLPQGLPMSKAEGAPWGRVFLPTSLPRGGRTGIPGAQNLPWLGTQESAFFQTPMSSRPNHPGLLSCLRCFADPSLFSPLGQEPQKASVARVHLLAPRAAPPQGLTSMG